MSLLSDTVIDHVEQLLLEDPAFSAGANSREVTSDEGDFNLINLYTFSLNQAIFLMQKKAFSFQVNNNSAPQPDLNIVDTTRSATA